MGTLLVKEDNRHLVEPVCEGVVENEEELQRLELHIFVAKYKKHLPLERPTSTCRIVK